MRMMGIQLFYMAICLAGIVAIFHVQRYRVTTGTRWWLYNVLALALCWEAFDAWKFGTPGFPASRWLLIPSMSAVLVWTAIVDWRRRRRAHAPK